MRTFQYKKKLSLAEEYLKYIGMYDSYRLVVGIDGLLIACFEPVSATTLSSLTGPKYFTALNTLRLYLSPIFNNVVVINNTNIRYEMISDQRFSL